MINVLAERGRDVPATETVLTEWLQIIEGEFLEIPGLNLTKPQVRRLWGLDTPTCDMVLAVLIDRRFLRCTDAGTYVRVEADR